MFRSKKDINNVSLISIFMNINLELQIFAENYKLTVPSNKYRHLMPAGDEKREQKAIVVCFHCCKVTRSCLVSNYSGK